MTKEVITTSQEELVEEAARKMAKHDISGLPVVDEAGRIKGIVTAEDVSKYIGGMKIGKI
jgi:CBS domain-containing protein